LDPSSFFLVCVHNVHCYPGIPSLLRDIFQANKGLYMKEGSRPAVEFHLRDLLIACNEELLVKHLSLVQSEYPSVQLGSYPNTSKTVNHRVKLTMESEDLHALDKAYTRLALLLPKDVMMSSSEVHNAPQSTDPRKEIGWLLTKVSPGVSSLLPPSLCSKIGHTLSMFERAYQEYEFQEVCVAFNGGKDCTVMLDLLHSYLVHKGHDFSQQKLQVLYVVCSKPFPEVETFVDESVSRYSLNLVKMEDKMQNALCQLKTSHPQFKAIMMGQRHTDPYCAKLSDFSPTDNSWPEYMRINCLLDWSYMDVWMLLRTMSIEYCPLYDIGYTSLDGVEDTEENPHLAVSTETQLLTGQPCVTGGYQPAYMLANEEHERAGRSTSWKTPFYE
jgi:FAD synthetase